MSYEILYSRQFVKLDDERVLPIILSGSSNCTMFWGKREIKERNWYLWYSNTDEIGAKTKDIRSKLESIVKENKEKNYNGEWFKSNGKWLTSSKILKWFDNGVKNARTIEEIFSRTYKTLDCHLTLYHKTEFKREEVLTRYCKTTQEINEWIDEAKKYPIPENYTVYWYMGFSGIEPLGLGKAVADDMAIICKHRGGYVYKYSDTSISYSPNKENAIVFANKAEFETKLLPTLRRFGSKYQLISAKAVERKTPKNYVIKVSERGAYVLKRTKSRVFFTRDIDIAKGFATEKATTKYINEKLQNFSVSFEPMCVGD